MADTKITALAAITTVDPAADVLPIVDISDTSMAASGTTKKITSNQILGSGGTATLASATITGDLTVDTSTLKVDSTNNRVGIGTASPAVGSVLDVVGTVSISGGTSNARRLQFNASGSYANWIEADGTAGANYLRFAAGNAEVMRIDVNGVCTWYDGVGGTRMTLNSTGLGVGVTPSAWATFKGLQSGTASLAGYAGGADTLIGANVYFDGAFKYISANIASSYRQLNGVHQWNTAATGLADALINGTGNFTQAMTLDASGNLLVGKTATNLQVVGCELKANGTVFSTLVDTTNAAASSYQLYSTGAAAYRFYVGMGGTVFATNTTISAISDARLKENVQDIDVGLDAILALKPRTFDWKAGKGKDIKGDRGFIAQEFETVFPNLIDEWKDAAPEGEAPYKSVRQDLIPVLVKAIQELTARVQTLEAR